MQLRYITWDEFKKVVSENNQLIGREFETIVYRGHSSCDWLLEPTLARFLKKNNIESEKYFEAIKKILSKRNYKSLIRLPEENPLNKRGWGMGDPGSEHSKDLVTLFLSIAWLRHHGFPSPILDWTNNHAVASWFAFGKGINPKGAAIYCLKKRNSTFSVESLAEKTSPQLELLMHHEVGKDIEEVKSCFTSLQIQGVIERHKNQESSYSLCLYKNINDQKYYFNLDAIDYLESPNYILEKYIIIDSHEKQKSILLDLKEVDGMCYEKLYGSTHPDENSYLVDQALEHFILERIMS